MISAAYTLPMAHEYEPKVGDRVYALGQNGIPRHGSSHQPELG
jgi:hypothetical protein